MAYPQKIEECAPDQRGTHVLAVKLAGPHGERWSAIGVGHSVEEALAWARDSAPSGTTWLMMSWSSLYGE